MIVYVAVFIYYLLPNLFKLNAMYLISVAAAYDHVANEFWQFRISEVTSSAIAVTYNTDNGLITPNYTTVGYIMPSVTQSILV